MVLGFTVSPTLLTTLGVLGGVLLILTMLVGLRIIRFQGRRHRTVHKALAWSMFAVATLHGLVALTYLHGWSILS